MSFSNAITVKQILSKTSMLKKSVQFRSVYICPDRSQDEREARKSLVVDLKTAIKEHPGRYHFISGGKIHSVDKAAT